MLPACFITAHAMIIDIMEVAFGMFLLWVLVMNGNIDALLAPLRQAWRRARNHSVPGMDAMQALADAHVTCMTPRAGLAIAIVTPTGTRQIFAGHIDGKASPVPNAGTAFEIGSITKTFTTALLVALEHAGSVTLDMRLDDLLPADAKPGQLQSGPITLEQLATHHSGLPRLLPGWPSLAGSYLSPRQPYRWTTQTALHRWLRHRRIRHQGRYHYSNLGYGILGHALARKIGLDYAAALQQWVLDPLGLAHTGVPMDNINHVAQPHTALGRRTPAWCFNALPGCGAIHSNLADMTRWLQANMQEQPPLDTRLHEPRADAGAPQRRIALGWHVDGDGERRVIWHNGGTGGSRSLIAFTPARGTGIVVLGNSAVSVDRLGMNLLRQTNQSLLSESSPAHA